MTTILKPYQRFSFCLRSTRVIAIWALIFSVCASGCITVTEEQLAALRSPNSVVREKTIKDISKPPGFPISWMGGLVSRANEEKAAAILADMLRGGKEAKDTRLAIIDALGELGRRIESPVPVLIEALKDKDPAVRAQASVALGKTRNKKASAALVKLLDKEPGNYPIIWALGEIADPKSIPSLELLLSSEDEFARYQARTALAKIGIGQAEADSNVKFEETENKTGLLGYLKIVFDKYQHAMTVIFQKIAGLRRVA